MPIRCRLRREISSNHLDLVRAGGRPTLAPNAGSIHTAAMSLKNAAFLALIGTLLLTIVLTVDFIKTVSGVLNDVVAAMELLRSLVYLLASLSMTVFFYVFNRAQSR